MGFNSGFKGLINIIDSLMDLHLLRVCVCVCVCVRCGALVKKMKPEVGIQLCKAMYELARESK